MAMRRNFTRGFAANVAELGAAAPPIAVLANGGRVDLNAPKLSPRLRGAIPGHLARINRYCGGMNLPYSVAQHAVILALELRRRVGPLAALYGLHHDDHEAVLGDIPFQTERALEAVAPGAIASLRNRIDAMLLPALGLEYPVPPPTAAELSHAHASVVLAEMRDLSLHYAPEIDMLTRAGVQPLAHHIRPLAWPQAEELYIRTRENLAIEAGIAP